MAKQNLALVQQAEPTPPAADAVDELAADLRDAHLVELLDRQVNNLAVDYLELGDSLEKLRKAKARVARLMGSPEMQDVVRRLLVLANKLKIQEDALRTD